jgi:glycosyltransferase involved in cell wall biosynthesis
VLHVIGNFHLGGSSQLVVDLFERLGHRYEQSVVARDLPSIPAYTGVPVEDGARLTTARSAERLVRRVRPDLVHVHFLGHHGNSYSERDWEWYHRVFRALEALGIPVVENVNVPVVPYASPAVRRYVYVSEYVERRFGLLGEPGIVVHPGSDLARFQRREETAPPEETIGMVYRLERDKLSDTSIAPIVEVLRRRASARALIVGDGVLRPVFQAAVHDAGVAGRCRFTGSVPYDALREHYERLTVFVAPVHRESFGQVTPFAMGMRLPVAGYRVGALEEILGDGATLAPAGDAEALAEIVVGLLDDPGRRRRIGDANAARARERFSVEAMVGAYERIYADALR